jgi:hypothetical protein
VKIALAMLAAAAAAALAVYLLLGARETQLSRDDGSREELLARIERLEAALRERPAERAADRPREGAPAPPDAARRAEAAPQSPARNTNKASAPGTSLSPRWYLEQYVASFENGGGGAEWFRLAVDAYALELTDDICGIVADPTAKGALRVKLAEILASLRFRGNPRAIDALLSLVRVRESEGLVKVGLDGLLVIGTPDTGLALEGLVWQMPAGGLQGHAFVAIARLAGVHANQAILRLLQAAPNEAARIQLIKLLDSQDLDAALEAFRWLSGQAQPVRLKAANKIDNFRTEALRAFVAEWLGFERDEEVRRALGAATQKMQQGASWNAKKATGPPDVDDPTRDHPNAWASRASNMGDQWLDLTYPQAMRASQVRIFEVSAAGAVTSVTLIEPSGAVHVVWNGVDPTPLPSVFEVSFAATNYLVKRVRIVLDTNHTQGTWSEIDAVELVGPDGRAWASDAAASSSYSENQ